MITVFFGLQERAGNLARNQSASASQGQMTEDVSVCAACQGSKVETEVYYFRQLEVLCNAAPFDSAQVCTQTCRCSAKASTQKTCRACMGEGVKNTKLIQ